jgi:hypothetical protein
MKGTPFRSSEEWKSALMTLPDHTFFELMRSIFGNIKTPFNKQRLMEDLATLFTREEIRKTIAAYIDERDHRIIAAVALLDEPVPEELEYFFAGEFSAAEIRVMLLNLEERFLLYRFRIKEVYHLALNPVLERVFAPFIADKGVLFPSLPAESGEGGETGEAPCPEGNAGGGAGKIPGKNPPDDRVLAALFAFVSEKREFFKVEGGLRKKTLDAGEVLFPGLPLEPFLGGFQCLGLLREDRGELFPEMPRLRAFGKLSRRERLEYCAAGIYTYLNGVNSPGVNRGIPGYFQRSSLRNLTSFMHHFLNGLEPRRRYPKSTLRRLVMFLEREEKASGPAAGEHAGAGYHFNWFLEALELTGLLELTAPDLRKTGAVLAPHFSDPALSGGGKPGSGEGAPAAPVLVMDTAFSFFLYPEITFADALTLAGFCSLRETGAVVRFEMTRQSVVRGFDQGLSAAAMTELLSRLSGNRTDQNIGWTLRDWETRYAAVSLYQGVVLTLAEDRRYLAETEPLASMVSRTLAPGVYLLSVPEKAPAVEVLEKAGVDMISQCEWNGNTGAQERPSFPVPGNGFPPWVPEFPLGEGLSGEEALPELWPDSAGAEDYKERFRAVLSKMELPKAEREELAARIERRLVLNESQLRGASFRYEKLEARGLDYVGKAAIAKQAIASKSLLEVLWPHPDGGTNKALGVPEALEKQQGESVLILKPLSSGEGDPGEPFPEEPGRAEPIRLPLGKISLLRRIKQSIFGE